ncbi:MULTISPECIES: PAS domain-containing protein [unclassified Flavobacterium]|jgi:PAS domain S-box-containing protein|uniref:sensor histidine kinase n=1 Tax=unclassified Flavobacterium TaxID=196869 RepID=UPI000A3D795A|nr:MULTISPECIES: PAS domain-containing sensor histidine kinase [unclassified Flavobacterium]MEA9414080.1 PAS domain-containing sensor histidine kinase [Flavobacterium sp. PL02]OUL62394.1 histidine kinase [Flavobacterium sp. AJR]
MMFDIYNKDGYRAMNSFPSKFREDGNRMFYSKVSNIKELRAQELKFKVLEERFQFALEASNTGVWDWDLKTNTVYYSSQSFKILEINSTDIFDNPERWDEIVHPDDLEEYYATINEHFDNKTPFYENFHRVLTSSGKYKWILDRGEVIERDYKGKPLRVIGTHTDITAQKEKELELVKTMKLYSEKNSQLLNFSHIVAHNLNSHAGNLKLLLDMIDAENKGMENSEAFSYLRTVSNDLNNTIADLSQIVNIQNNQNIIVKPLNLNSYLKKVLDIVSAYKYKNFGTIINNIPEEATINFNPAYLESVLLNFCTNAIKYADPERALIIEFNFFIENGKKTFTITDNGLGIDLKKHGDLLFDMYKTFHKHEDAHGIGLYITKNQIESMNGAVNVASEVGVGSTFTVTFND